MTHANEIKTVQDVIELSEVEMFYIDQELNAGAEIPEDCMDEFSRQWVLRGVGCRA